MFGLQLPALAGHRRVGADPSAWPETWAAGPGLPPLGADRTENAWLAAGQAAPGAGQPCGVRCGRSSSTLSGKHHGREPTASQAATSTAARPPLVFPGAPPALPSLPCTPQGADSTLFAAPLPSLPRCSLPRSAWLCCSWCPDCSAALAASRPSLPRRQRTRRRSTDLNPSSLSIKTLTICSPCPAALSAPQAEYKEALNRQVRLQQADASSSSAAAASAADEAFLQSKRRRGGWTHTYGAANSCAWVPAAQGGRPPTLGRPTAATGRLLHCLAACLPARAK